MSKTIFIDTLFVVALVNQRDQHHARAAELAHRFERGRFLTNDAILLEIGNSLAKRFRGEAATIVQGFLDSPDVEIARLTPALFDEAFRLFREHQDKEWGLIDCVSFAAMRRAGIDEALTFDQHFVQAGFRALMRET